jgi:hypothetical protein
MPPESRRAQCSLYLHPIVRSSESPRKGGIGVCGPARWSPGADDAGREQYADDERVQDGIIALRMISRRMSVVVAPSDRRTPIS